MKTALLFLSFLLLASYALAAAPPPVVDTAGKILRVGLNYYILPFVVEPPVSGRGGGLTLATTRNKTCPLDVVQELQEVENGLPVTFMPVNSKKGVIRESTDLNIKFKVATNCSQSTVWKVDDYDELRGQYFVTTGGVIGNPGPKTLSNWFKIEVFIDDYKIVYCPTVCKFCKVACKDVAIFVDNGRRYLALTDQPRRVIFKKA